MSTSEEKEVWFELRSYLLGISKRDSDKERIEERLMLDDDYFQKLLMEEEQLIDDYVNEDLEDQERTAFENHFLISAERRKKVEHTRELKKYIDDNEIAETLPAFAEEHAGQSKWKKLKDFLLSPRPAFASIILLSGIVFILWWNFYRPDDNLQQALASLNKAHAAARPLESRVSQLDYAPFDKQRGQDESEVDWVNKNRAERILLDEVSKNPTVQNQHLLARAYLTGKDFDKALQLLEKILRQSPPSAEILNDIGVIYVEKSKLTSNDSEKIPFVATAMENFDKAIAIDPNFLPARFNKAIATEIYLPKRAKEAWNEYLNLDQTSDWANEARQHLEELNKQITQDIPTADKMESDFRQAYEEQDDEKAFQIASRNRELISEKYLPQRLGMNIVNKKKTNEIRKSNC